MVYALLFCLAEGVAEGGWTNIWDVGRAEGPGDWLWDMMAVLWAASEGNETLSWHFAIYYSMKPLPGVESQKPLISLVARGWSSRC